MLAHVRPSVDDCQPIFGVGVPVTATLNVAAWPTTALVSAGLVVKVGAASAGVTARCATALVTWPTVFETETRNAAPLSDACTGPIASVCEVAPSMFAKV